MASFNALPFNTLPTLPLTHNKLLATLGLDDDILRDILIGARCLETKAPATKEGGDNKNKNTALTLTNYG
eukprot:8131064-Lingulodinium_polyedra.AAC.1